MKQLGDLNMGGKEIKGREVSDFRVMLQVYDEVNKRIGSKFIR